MPCYTPLGVKLDVDGKPVFKRFMQCEPDQWIPCGKCIGCRLDYSREWAIRLQHEQITSHSSCWITLTYDDDHLPVSDLSPHPSLSKSDWTTFTKSLRNRGYKFKCYAAGEYGDRFGRPHFHACMFNLDFPDRRFKYTTDTGYEVHSSQILTDIWGKGFADVSDLSYDNAAYTARYTLKKIYGEAATDHYRRWDAYGNQYWIEPEFSIMSRGGRTGRGIGYDFYQQYGDRIRFYDSVAIDGHEFPVPRYYDKLTEQEYPAEYERIKERRLLNLDPDNPDQTFARRMARLALREKQITRLYRPLE